MILYCSLPVKDILAERCLPAGIPHFPLARKSLLRNKALNINPPFIAAAPRCPNNQRTSKTPNQLLSADWGFGFTGYLLNLQTIHSLIL